MTQYLLLIHDNARKPIAPEPWTLFFEATRQSGFFKGGSQLGKAIVLGDQQPVPASDTLAGYMRFDTDDKQALLTLLEKHPVVAHGGSIELCEMPKS